MPQRDDDARARQAARARLRNRKASDVAGIRADLAIVYRKPLDDWSLEELARGRPTSFAMQPIPPYLAAVIGPELSRRIKNSARLQMSQHLPDAVRVLHELMNSTATDAEGRPLVDAKVTADIAKFLVEHNLGNPRVGGDRRRAERAQHAGVCDGHPRRSPRLRRSAGGTRRTTPADVSHSLSVDLERLYDGAGHGVREDGHFADSRSSARPGRADLVRGRPFVLAGHRKCDGRRPRAVVHLVRVITGAASATGRLMCSLRGRILVLSVLGHPATITDRAA